MITLEKKGPIAILTLNRPDAMNALGEPGDGEAVRDACAADQRGPDAPLRHPHRRGQGLLRRRQRQGDARPRRLLRRQPGRGPRRLQERRPHDRARALQSRNPADRRRQRRGHRPRLRCRLHGRHPHLVGQRQVRRHLPEARPHPRRWRRLAAAARDRHEPRLRTSFHRQPHRREDRAGLGPRLQGRARRPADGRSHGACDLDRQTAAAVAARRQAAAAPRHAGRPTTRSWKCPPPPRA